MTRTSRIAKRELIPNSLLLVAVTLLAGGLFKISAFAREAFIASRFGLSAITDAYFALQQLPLTLATFMFGSFALAFTPAYAEARRQNETVRWLPGLLAYASLLGICLTALTFASSSLLLATFTRSPQPAARTTLAILSTCYLPIVLIGICAGICTSYGRNLWSMTLTGLPYLVMTATLLVIYAAGALSDLSLPVSMTAGFCSIGLVSLAIVLLRERPRTILADIIQPWRVPGFRNFLQQLTASSVESIGFTSNQLLLMHFLAFLGTGAISANNCASRIGMLGYSLIAQPLGQYMQGRMCVTHAVERENQFRRFLLVMAVGTTALASLVCILRYPIAESIYMRGKFSRTELESVVSSLPAWLAYFVVLSLNACVAKYFFVNGKGSVYTRHMLGGYIVANVLRFTFASHSSAALVVWCAVIGEGGALLLNLRTSLWSKPAAAAVPFAAHPEMQEI
jgi:putative peptidoglycan lipid II flippase